MDKRTTLRRLIALILLVLSLLLGGLAPWDHGGSDLLPGVVPTPPPIELLG